MYLLVMGYQHRHDGDAARWCLMCAEYGFFNIDLAFRIEDGCTFKKSEDFWKVYSVAEVGFGRGDRRHCLHHLKGIEPKGVVYWQAAYSYDHKSNGSRRSHLSKYEIMPKASWSFAATAFWPGNS